MVRAIATSVGVLRAGRGALRLTASRVFRDRATPVTDALLERGVPILAALFLVFAAIGLIVQFTSHRDTMLRSEEASLELAVRLAAHETAQRVQAGLDPATALDNLPSTLLAPGRLLLLVNGAGTVIGRRGGPVAEGDIAVLNRAESAGRVARVELGDGRLASAVRAPLATGGLTLLAFHAIDDELRQWRTHVDHLLSVLASFAAVTIALVLAFYAQRRRTTEAGHLAEATQTRLDVALERAHCGFWDWDATSRRLRWSSAMWRLLGEVPSSASLGWVEVVRRLHPEDRRLLERVRDPLPAGGEVDQLFRMRHREGHWVWMRLRAVRVDQPPGEQHVIAVVMDVTAERVAEAEARRADIRLRDAIETIPEAFVLWDENNRLVLCNSKYQAFHGLPREAVQPGNRYRAVMAEAIQPRVVIENERESGDAGDRSYEAQFHDGRWLLVSERHTQAGGFVSVGTDITARKQQEDRLIENERQLRSTIADLDASREALKDQARQMSDLADRYLEQKAEALSANRVKAEFLANMNHEIRTPLNHILGFAEMIEAQIHGPVGSDRYLEYAHDIRRSGACLLDLIRDILDMARIEAGRISVAPREHAIGALLGEAAANVRADAAAKGVALDIEPLPDAPGAGSLVQVDGDLMGQALAHLLRNSIRLSPVGGRVSLRARPNGRHLNLFIADRGSVLSPCEMRTLYDPFGHIERMLHDGCKGSGLGMALARSLIALHGGTIRLRSSPGTGSLVMVHLPIDGPIAA